MDVCCLFMVCFVVFPAERSTGSEDTRAHWQMNMKGTGKVTKFVLGFAAVGLLQGG